MINAERQHFHRWFSRPPAPFAALIGVAMLAYRRTLIPLVRAHLADPGPAMP